MCVGKFQMSKTENHANCWACNTALEEGQIFCLKCEKWQNYRKHFSLSTTVLSLLIALIAVSSPILQKVASLYDPIKVQASFYSIGTERHPDAALKVVNQGKSTVIFTGTVFCDYQIRAEKIDDVTDFFQAEFRMSMEFEVPDAVDRSIKDFQVYKVPQRQIVLQKNRPALSDLDAWHMEEYEPVNIISVYHPDDVKYTWITDLGCTMSIAQNGEIREVKFSQSDNRLLWKVHLRSLVEDALIKPEWLRSSPLVNRPFVGYGGG